MELLFGGSGVDGDGCASMLRRRYYMGWESMCVCGWGNLMEGVKCKGYGYLYKKMMVSYEK